MLRVHDFFTAKKFPTAAIIPADFSLFSVMAQFFSGNCCCFSDIFLHHKLVEYLKAWRNFCSVLFFSISSRDEDEIVVMISIYAYSISIYTLRVITQNFIAQKLPMFGGKKKLRKTFCRVTIFKELFMLDSKKNVSFLHIKRELLVIKDSNREICTNSVEVI